MHVLTVLKLIYRDVGAYRIETDLHGLQDMTDVERIRIIIQGSV